MINIEIQYKIANVNINLFLLMLSLLTFQHENPVLVKEHNHDASQVGVGVAKIKADLREKAQNSRARPALLLASELSSSTVSDGVKANCGRVETMKKMIRRKQRGALPKTQKPFRVED